MLRFLLFLHRVEAMMVAMLCCFLFLHRVSTGQAAMMAMLRCLAMLCFPVPPVGRGPG